MASSKNLEYNDCKAMGLGAHPLNALNTFDKLGKISDDIWYISGDRSTDVRAFHMR
jgi:ubiquinone biosynthesis protein COQ9